MKNMARSCKGMSLIVVIFAILLLGSIGWTLAALQSGNFQENLSALNSERALDMAESGTQWALYQLLSDPTWRQVALLHTLDFGQYEIICRNPIGSETGDAIIESTGYYPAKVGYTALRKLKLAAKLGNNSYAVQVNGTFNWDVVSSISINAAMACGHYEGNDSNHTLDQPADFLIPQTRRSRDIIIAGTAPIIDMNRYESNAALKYNIAAETTVSSVSGNNTVYAGTNFFKPFMVGQVLRNVTNGTWDDTNWAVISSVDTTNGAWAKLNRNIVGNDWKNDTVRIVKRICEIDADRYRKISGINFYCYTNKGIFYIKGNGSAKGDVLIDLANNLYFDRTYIVAEGDIVIKGGGSINMLTNNRIGVASPPNLATKEGNIISSAPTSGSSAAKLRARSFDGFVYSQDGNAEFDYYYGNALAANNVTLFNSVTMVYSASRSDPPDFVIAPVVITWQET